MEVLVLMHVLFEYVRWNHQVVEVILILILICL